MTYQFCCVSIWYGGGLSVSSSSSSVEIDIFIIVEIITILDYMIDLLCLMPLLANISIRLQH